MKELQAQLQELRSMANAKIENKENTSEENNNSNKPAQKSKEFKSKTNIKVNHLTLLAKTCSKSK